MSFVVTGPPGATQRLPQGFEYLPGSGAQYWIPLKPANRGSVVARLAPGVTPTAAASQIEPLLRDVPASTSGRPLGYEIVPLRSQLVAPVKTALLMLFGAVGVVLLIACINVANLTIARSLMRRREMAIRRAVGASNRHLLSLAAFESLLLTGAAAAIAVGLAAGGVRVLKWLAIRGRSCHRGWRRSRNNHCDSDGMISRVGVTGSRAKQGDTELHAGSERAREGVCSGPSLGWLNDRGRPAWRHLGSLVRD